MAGVGSRIHDRDPHALAGERFGDAIEAHQDLSPAVSKVDWKACDRLLQRAKPDDVDLAVGQLRVGQILIPVVAWRAHEQGTWGLARERDQWQRNLAPLVGTA